MSASLPSLAFIGAGSMGGAILRGVVASGIPVESIVATNRTAEKAAELAALPGVTSLALADDPGANVRVASEARIVVVGVKPAMVVDLLTEIAPILREDAIVVSVAAGVTIAQMNAALGGKVSVIRTMPNTPAIVGKAVTGVAAAAGALDAERAIVRQLFETVGSVVELDEDQINALSTISGSGPAYVYYFIEELTRTAIAKGFSTEQARLLAEQTFIGAAALLEATGEDPAELRRQVTSPKGSTERAINVFEASDLNRIFVEATDAALARSRELAND